MFSRDSLYRWGGGAFMLGNLLFLADKFNEMSRLFLFRWVPDVISGQDVLLILIGQVALIFGYMAFFRLYTRHAGRYGRIALGLFCGGCILLAVGHLSFMSDIRTPVGTFEPLFLFVLIGLAVMLVGLIWFGIANLRWPVLGRWQWLPLATGLMGAVGFFLFGGEQITATFLLFRTLFALGLIGLGLVLWLEKLVQPGLVSRSRRSLAPCYAASRSSPSPRPKIPGMRIVRHTLPGWPCPRAASGPSGPPKVRYRTE